MNENHMRHRSTEHEIKVVQAAPLQPPAKKGMSRGLYTALIIPACFVAGVGGAAVYTAVVPKADGTQVINRDKVVLQEGEVVAAAAKKVGSSVVSIITEQTARTMMGYSSLQQGAGTGIIISADGYVVTNKHVVSSESQSIEVVLADGTSYKDVKYVGSDPSNDVTFLKIQNVKSLTPAVFGDSSKVEVGQKVIAIGNALGEYQNTVTTGIISALGRPVTASDESGRSSEQLENLLQTDAAINPGNSGGPLLNLSGEVIGINTAIASGAQGIGFSIPINDIKGMLKGLFSEGKVIKPYIGVRYVTITPDVASRYSLKVRQGALLLASEGQSVVASGSPAEKAGFKAMDIITKINGMAVDGTHPFASLVAQLTPGQQAVITYLRDGKEATVTLTVASRS